MRGESGEPHNVQVRIRVPWVALAVAFVSAAGCASLVDLDALESGAFPTFEKSDAADSDAGPIVNGADGAIPARDAASLDGSRNADGGCPDGAGPPMVLAGPTCIDATEVTMGHYNELIQRADAAAFQPPACESNDVFEPSTLVVSPWPPPSDWLELPMQGVNHCAAAAYCNWAGKHLCGHVKEGL